MNSDPFPKEAGVTLDVASHKYFHFGVPVRWSVSGVLKESGVLGRQWADEEDMKFGSDVHLTTQLYDEGRLDYRTLDPRLAGYLEGWRKFRQETGFIPHKIERRICDPRLGVAGTLDRFGEARCPLPWLVDIKKYPVPKWCALQTAAYKYILGIPCRRFGVELKQAGTYKMKEFSDAGDIQEFLHLVAALNIRQKYTGGKDDGTDRRSDAGQRAGD